MNHSLFLCFCLWLFTGANPVFAQDPLSLPDANQLDTFCEQVVSPDSAYGFVRILERENSEVDFMQVNVEVELQIADYEPCVATRTTPVELYLPEESFSLKLSRQKGQNQFQFSIHRKRLGPILFMKDVNDICLAYDAEWKHSTWC